MPVSREKSVVLCSQRDLWTIGSSKISRDNTGLWSWQVVSRLFPTQVKVGGTMTDTGRGNDRGVVGRQLITSTNRVLRVTRGGGVTSTSLFLIVWLLIGPSLLCPLRNTILFHRLIEGVVIVLFFFFLLTVKNLLTCWWCTVRDTFHESV